MKIKFREKDKIICWIIVGFFAIMTVLTLLKPLWANAEASETIPATTFLETEPQETEGTTMIIVEFIEPTQPTHPVIAETNKAEGPSNKVPKETEDSKVEESEKTERNEEEKLVITEPAPEPEIKIEVETNTEIETNTEAETDSNSEDSNLKSLGTFKLTAYCACSKCCGKSDGITASGTKAKQGRTIAVNPKQIPYGTKVIINGHTYIAEDCGGGVGKSRIDVFFDNHKEALNFGVQYAEVFIYVS